MRPSPITGRPWHSSPTTRRPTTTSAMALAGRGLFDEAIADCQKAMEIKPDFVAAHNNLGNALLCRGLVDEAIVQYQKALKLNPDYAEAHNNLGNALARRGQFDEAIAHYRKALEIKPDYAAAAEQPGRHLAGTRKDRRGDGPLPEGLGNQARLRRGPLQPRHALAGRGQIDEAIAHYRKALEIKPDYADAHYNLGNALAGRGRFEEAIAHYRKALEIRPDSRRGPQQPGRRSGRPWRALMRPSPITARPWKSSRLPRRRGGIWPSPWPNRNESARVGRRAAERGDRRRGRSPRERSDLFQRPGGSRFFLRFRASTPRRRDSWRSGEVGLEFQGLAVLLIASSKRPWRARALPRL